MCTHEMVRTGCRRETSPDWVPPVFDSTGCRPSGRPGRRALTMSQGETGHGHRVKAPHLDAGLPGRRDRRGDPDARCRW